MQNITLSQTNYASKHLQRKEHGKTEKIQVALCVKLLGANAGFDAVIMMMAGFLFDFLGNALQSVECI